jgi:RNA polymerase sigma-70 factor (ECF subfamily)
VWQAVDGLADHHRLVIILRYLYDLPYREIADILEIRLGTVKSRLHTAHRHLRQRLATDQTVVEEARARV